LGAIGATGGDKHPARPSQVDNDKYYQ